ncbi:ABC transporter permease, partial [Geobacillus sp. LEMMJ02]
MDLLNTMIERKQEIWIAFQEHILLSGIAMIIAILVAVPLGIVLTRHKKLAEPIIGIA